MTNIQLTLSEFVALYGLASIGMLFIILRTGQYIVSVWQGMK